MRSARLNAAVSLADAHKSLVGLRSLVCFNTIERNKIEKAMLLLMEVLCDTIPNHAVNADPEFDTRHGHMVYFTGYLNDDTCDPCFMEDKIVYTLEDAIQECDRMNKQAKSNGYTAADGSDQVYVPKEAVLVCPKGYNQ